MKVAILTLSASDNCGSLLQAYALQQVLENAGHEVKILSFITKKSKKMYRIFHPSYIKEPRKLIGIFVKYSEIKSQKKDYQSFRNQYLNMSTEQYKNSDDLKYIDGEYDLIICGSDQVWNTDMADFDEAYLLKWCKISKKAGYAVSLGDKKNRDIRVLIEKLTDIADFSAISLREKSAVNKFIFFGKKEVKLCLDPTLLMTCKGWESIINSDIAPKIPYIFYYSYNYADDIKNQIVSKFSLQKGLPVYVINRSKWCDGKEKKYGFKVCEKSGPIAFLSLMRYCECSLVESFHGTLFSYIFKKPFWFLKNTDDEILDDRINDIMEILDMKDRILHPSDSFDSIDMVIDYKLESDEFKKIKGESLKFLAAITEG